MPRTQILKHALVLVALIGTAGANPASSAPDDGTALTEVIRNIQAVYETSTDWKADFSQTTQFEGFDTPIASKGTLYIKKPGKLRWDYREPNRHEIIVNQDTIWIYTPEQQQVIVSPFAQVSDSRLPLHLLTGIGRLDRDFTVQWTDPDQPRPDGMPALTLIPRETGTGLSRLWMEVDPVRHFITKLTLFEAGGNRSEFQFSRIRNNTGIRDRLFIFTPPKGVAVIESPPESP